MASRFDKSALLGVVEAKAAFQAVEPVLRDKINDATEETVRVIAFQAKQRVRRRFGILADHIQWSMSRATGVGKVGIGPREKITLPGGLKSRTVRHGGHWVTVLGIEQPTKIAHDVEFGHAGPHPAPAHAFMIPAAEGEKANYLTRVQQAGSAAEAQLAAKNYATGWGDL